MKPLSAFVLPVVLTITCTASAGPEDAAQNLAQFVQIAGVLQGFSPRGEIWRGQLTPGESTVISENLMFGNEYLILAAGDAAASDLNLEVYDSSLALVDADLGDDNTPVVTVLPEQTGVYNIKVTLASSTGPAAWYALQIMYR